MTTLTEARRRAALLDTRPWEARRIERDEEAAAAAARALVAELERTQPWCRTCGDPECEGPYQCDGEYA